MKGLIKILSIFLLFLTFPSYAIELSKIQGFLKIEETDLFTATGIRILDKNAVKNLLRSRLSFDWKPAEHFHLFLSGDIEAYEGNNTGILSSKLALSSEENNILNLEGKIHSQSNFLLYGRLYRGYITARYSNFSITIGRQKIDWGRGYFFTPLNLFTPTINVSAEPSQVIGVDSVYISYDLSDFYSLSAVYSPAKNFENHKFGFNFSGVFKGVDFNLLYIFNGEKHIAGTSVAFNLFEGVGRMETRFFEDYKPDVLVGYDRTFPYLINLTIEYYFHPSEGKAHKSDYPTYVDPDRLRSISFSDPTTFFSMAGLFSNFFEYSPGTGKLGQDYLAILLSKEFNYPFSFSVIYETNLNDGSFLIMPYINWSPFYWIEVSGGAMIPNGNTNDEFWWIKNVYFFNAQIYF